MGILQLAFVSTQTTKPPGQPGWRSPSGATEDRNPFWAWAASPALSVAVALQGGRGSQRPCERRPAPHPPAWRSPSGGTEDRNGNVRRNHEGHREGGGCPSGRPRIATARAQPNRTPPPSGGRPPGRPRIATCAPQGCRSRRRRGGRPPGRPRIATVQPALGKADSCRVVVALRGGQGSQQEHGGATREHPQEWRSSSRATEDRNMTADRAHSVRIRWRSSSGATEDRNQVGDGRHGAVVRV